MKNNKLEIGLHIFVWVTYTFLWIDWFQDYNPYSEYGVMSRSSHFIYLFCYLCTFISFFYFNYLYLLPRFLMKKKVLKYSFFTLLSLVIVYLFLVLQGYITDRIFNTGMTFFNLRAYSYSLIIINFHFYLFISMGARFIVDWFKTQKIREEIDSIKSQAELSALSQKLSPHFLFNSLNNIYSLVNRNDSRAADSILMMSDIMRYILYDCNNGKVTIARELLYVRNFIELNKLRLDRPEIVQLNIQIDDDNGKVSPLLFIPFIENAFKHGETSDIDKPIIFSFYKKINMIKFNSSNSYKPKRKDLSSGIGVSNTKRRLELLYPNSHTLKISDDGSKFVVELTIRLYDAQLHSN